MKKLYIDIRFAKCILALTAGWLMAGCSAEDELGNGSATQQLSMTPMVNDLQQTRVKEEKNLNEKNLLSLDFKMFEPTSTSSEPRIDHQFDTPEENKAEELASGNWKSTLHLDVNKTYPYYAVANAKDNLKVKNLAELLACTQQDDDIWKPATMVNDKKFLMSSQGEYTITQDPEQNIPVELVRAAAKIKLNISSTVKDYKITKVKWKFINYNTNTAIFANQPADQKIKKNIQENKATAEKDENGNDIYKVTTYSYSTTWNGKEDMPQIVAAVTFKKNTDTTTITKELVIPVRDPQGEKKLERNYIYTVNAVIKYLDTNTHIDYNGKEDYLQWAITKWTTGENTEVYADKTTYLVVSPTAIDIKGGEDNEFTDYSIRWFASNKCKIENPTTYYFDRYGNSKSEQNGQIDARSETATGDGYRGWIDVHAGAPSYCTIQYTYFDITVDGTDKKQEIAVRKYPSVYSMNVRSEGTNDSEEKNHLYTIQLSSNKYATDYTIAKPVLNKENKSANNTVSPAYILASTAKGERKVENNQAARDYCKKYQEKATTYKNENLELKGWRLPTKEEINRIYKLGNEDKAISKELLRGEYYWTLDGDKTVRNDNNPQNGTYVRCVHDLTQGEIELIEKQGEK